MLLVIVVLIAHPAAVCAWQRPEARSPDAVILATVEKDCTVVLRDVASGNAIATLYEPSDACRGGNAQMGASPWIALSPDGRLLATDRGYGPLDLWRVRDLRKVASFNAGHIGSLEFLLDSTVILVVATDGKLAHRNEIRVWEIATQKQLFYARESDAIQFKKATLSPDGKMIFAIVGPSGRVHVNARYVMDRIKLWDIEDPKEPVIFKGESAEFSQDGKQLLVTDSGRKMLWDIKAGKMSTAAQPGSPHPARDLTADNVAESIGNDKWNWTVFIKGERQNIDDVKCVEYTLHPSFSKPVRLVCEPGDPQRPFGLSATGWGTFSIGIRILMKDGTHQDLRHQLKF